MTIPNEEETKTNDNNRSIRSHVVIGLGLIGVFVGGLGGYGVTVPLAGAVLGSGQVVVESSVRTVQHPTGGIIGQLFVREGHKVAEGDLLIRLDDTVTRANLQMVLKQLTDLTAREARLESERDGRDAIIFPASLTDRVGDSDAQRAMDGEMTLFTARRNAREGTRRQLQERMAQVREEIEGLKAQEAARRRQAELMARELVDIGDLFRRNLVPRTRMVELEREAARLQGDVGQFVSERARAQGRIAETELQIIQIDSDLRREVSTELREVQARIGEFTERRVAAEDQLKRIDIRSPSEGTIHQLAVVTLGGVIQAGAPIMQVVPLTEKLTMEARMQPHDIEQVAVGLPAFVRFSAFPHGTTPEVPGRVTRVSADAVREQQTGMSYFTVRVAVDDADMARIPHVRLVPGMPIEVFVRTGDRTAMSYLLKPLTDQMARAWREN